MSGIEQKLKSDRWGSCGGAYKRNYKTLDNGKPPIENLKCPWCDGVFYEHEPKIKKENEYYHPGCLKEFKSL